MSKIVVFGSSFNPPTIAHKSLLTAAVDGTGADLGIFVPSNEASLKKEMAKTDCPYEVLSERTRSFMLDSVCAGDERLSVDEGEYGTAGPGGVSIETMKRMQEKYPDAEQLYFLFDGDTLKTLARSKTLREFCESFKIIVFSREGFDPEYEIENTKGLKGFRDAFVILPLPEGIDGISPEAVRDAARKGDDETVKSMVIPQVSELLPATPVCKETGILFFQGRYEFLSNSYLAEVQYENMTYLTNEAAFQAARTLKREDRAEFTEQKSASVVKRLGKKVKQRADWERAKVGIMEKIVRAKFTQNRDLAAKLVATGTLPILECDDRRDAFWGVDVSTGRGENHLGKILMKIRGELGGAGDTSDEFIFPAALTPGFQEYTLAAEGKTPPPAPKKDDAEQSEDPEEKKEEVIPEIDFVPGMLLCHPAFGMGFVISLSGTGKTRILDAEFSYVGPKRLRAVWVERSCTVFSE